MFIEQTGEYYRKEAGRLLEEHYCSTSMNKSLISKALIRLNEENLRSRRFLNPSSYIKVNQELQKKLVDDILVIFHAECKNLIENEVNPGKFVFPRIEFIIKWNLIK